MASTDWIRSSSVWFLRPTLPQSDSSYLKCKSAPGFAYILCNRPCSCISSDMIKTRYTLEFFLFWRLVYSHRTSFTPKWLLFSWETNSLDRMTQFLSHVDMASHPTKVQKRVCTVAMPRTSSLIHWLVLQGPSCVTAAHTIPTRKEESEHYRQWNLNLEAMKCMPNWAPTSAGIEASLPGSTVTEPKS